MWDTGLVDNKPTTLSSFGAVSATTLVIRAPSGELGYKIVPESIRVEKAGIYVTRRVRRTRITVVTNGIEGRYRNDRKKKREIVSCNSCSV